MKCILMGIQTIDFVSQETGERIEGSKLHVVSELKEGGSGMMGQRVASLFTKLPVKDLKIGGHIELGYEQMFGSNKSRLVSVTNI